MTTLIAEYEKQLEAITARIKKLKRKRRSASGNIMYGRLTRRIEALEEECSELHEAIGEMKKHL